jgi:hypothetical protein
MLCTNSLFIWQLVFVFVLNIDSVCIRTSVTTAIVVSHHGALSQRRVMQSHFQDRGWSGAIAEQIAAVSR